MSFRLLILGLLITCSLPAQTAVLTGRVTDESSASVPGAKITLQGPGGVRKSATSTADGSYSIPALPLGDYTIAAAAPDLSMPPAKITLHGGSQTLDLQLKISLTTQQVTVESDTGPKVSTDTSSNASALVLAAHDLRALSDDPEDLPADLQALAGPSAGPGGGAIFIDGFSGGELPPKESIREIRINQNPFSPEYDKLGYGRIEIFTKPGTDKFHGTVGYNLGDRLLEFPQSLLRRRKRRCC